MKNKYLELKLRHQKELNTFPMFFTFSNNEFDEGMKILGLDPSETDKFYRLGNTGGFFHRSDTKAFREMFYSQKREMTEAIDSDTTGDGFIYKMFKYELANHEYCITYDISETLDVLGITEEEITNNPKMSYALQRAINAQFENEDENI